MRSLEEPEDPVPEAAEPEAGGAFLEPPESEGASVGQQADRSFLLKAEDPLTPLTQEEEGAPALRVVRRQSIFPPSQGPISPSRPA